MRTRIGQIFCNAALVVVSIAALALLLEGASRIYAGLMFPKMMVLDDKLGWRHGVSVSKMFQNELGEKFLVVQDEFGHRGGGHAKQRPAGKYRILTLGDSFTEGSQVGEPDLFTAQLERADSHLDVINAGVSGYGTVQEYLYLTSDRIEFKPDLVLLMFFENDLTDNLLNYYPAFGPKPFARLTEDGVDIVEKLDASEFSKYILPVPFEMALNKYSILYYFINSRVYQPMFARTMRQMEQADLHRLNVNDRYTAFFGLLDKFTQYLNKQRIPLLVVLIPTREQAAEGHSDASSIIDEHCRMQGIHCLPLLDRFHMEVSSGSKLYFREDMHWTKEGHRVAATEILKSVLTEASNRAGRYDESNRTTQ